MLSSGTFPWSVAPKMRAELLSPEIREWIRPLE
jgi:asparagine synthase (glutamine-hydrolysing)